jgi:hypothetical protein
MSDMKFDLDAAFATGTNSEFMRICREIEKLMETCSSTSYGIGQRIILRRLRDKITPSNR